MVKRNRKQKADWIWDQMVKRDMKIRKAKQEGKERRQAEKQAELDKRNSLYITNLPNNLQKITNKNSK